MTNSPTPQDQQALAERVKEFANNSDVVLLDRNVPGLRADLRALLARSEALEAENERLRAQVAEIREQFFCLIADARRWDEDVDGDADSEGRPYTIIHYFGEFQHSSLDDFIEALGIERRFDETAGDALFRAMEATDAS